MTYEWESNILRTKCKAWRHEPLKNEADEEEFHLKSVMSTTINSWGHGKSLDEAQRDLEANIASLYPNEMIRA